MTDFEKQRAKEKAEELVTKFKAYVLHWDYVHDEYLQNDVINESAKQCALIAVDEILECHIWKYNSIEPYKFYQQVKKEIEEYNDSKMFDG
jgi:hypothetical protein